MKDIKDLNIEELEAFLIGIGQPGFHARQIFSWIYAKNILDFKRMSNLSIGLRQSLEDNFFIVGISLLKKLDSSDGSEKFLFKLKDGNFIEAVAIPAQSRLTGCISTQLGCRFACRFCASASAGFKRNLTSGEILDQVLCLKNNSMPKKITHLVFMGTGEPLDNYDNLLKAVRLINSADGFNLAARRITISTSGIIPAIKRLAGEGLQVELSVSLHAPDDKTRSMLMPVNKIYPLKELIQACRDYILQTRRQITFEYTLIRGRNSDLQNAQKLAKLLAGLNCKVNLIPANPIKKLNLKPPQEAEISAFKRQLLKSKIKATLRKPRGQDIQGACGQLSSTYEGD